MARCRLLWRFRSMAAYTEERGSGSIGRKVELVEWSNFCSLWTCAICGGDDFQLGTSSSVVFDFDSRVKEGRGEQNKHSLRRQNGGAVLVTHCTSRWGSFTVLFVSVYWHFSLSFLSTTSFWFGLFCQGSLNTVREFPKFVRHLVRVLKVVLFKVFLDFRFN